ncbi:MAG: hypothetical protein JWO06_1191 [Bacteroidota bacterium]|nr:hypothetical protein [Bacteroidota bacterium]
MTILQKRKRVKELIDKASEPLLNEIIKLAEAKSRKVVGYTMEGTELTKGELQQIVQDAEVRYKKGEAITHEKARKQSKKW